MDLDEEFDELLEPADPDRPPLLDAEPTEVDLPWLALLEVDEPLEATVLLRGWFLVVEEVPELLLLEPPAQSDRPSIRLPRELELLLLDASLEIETLSEGDAPTLESVPVGAVLAGGLSTLTNLAVRLALATPGL